MFSLSPSLTPSVPPSLTPSFTPSLCPQFCWSKGVCRSPQDDSLPLLRLQNKREGTMWVEWIYWLLQFMSWIGTFRNCPEVSIGKLGRLVSLYTNLCNLNWITRKSTPFVGLWCDQKSYMAVRAQSRQVVLWECGSLVNLTDGPSSFPLSPPSLPLQISSACWLIPMVQWRKRAYGTSANSHSRYYSPPHSHTHIHKHLHSWALTVWISAMLAPLS